MIFWVLIVVVSWHSQSDIWYELKDNIKGHNMWLVFKKISIWDNLSGDYSTMYFIMNSGIFCVLEDFQMLHFTLPTNFQNNQWQFQIWKSDSFILHRIRNVTKNTNIYTFAFSTLIFIISSCLCCCYCC